MCAWLAVTAASCSCAAYALLCITSNALVLRRSRIASAGYSASSWSELLLIHLPQVPVGRWTCPHHFCCVCEKKSQDCSNCLFRFRPRACYVSEVAATFFTRKMFKSIHPFSDAKCVPAHSVKTASLMTCRSCQSTIAVSRKKYNTAAFCF